MSVELGRRSLDDCLSSCIICAQSNLKDMISFCVYHRSDLDADRLLVVTAIILNSEKDTLFLVFFILVLLVVVVVVVVVAKDGEELAYRRR